MCEVFSFIGLPNGGVVRVPEAYDSHRLMLLHLGLDERDGSVEGRFARLEVVLPDDLEWTESPWETIIDEKNWVMQLDECRTPVWYPGVEDLIRANAFSAIRRMLVNDTRKALIGGTWVLGPRAVVDEVSGASIVVNYGRVTDMSYSLVGRHARGAYIRDLNYSRIQMSEGQIGDCQGSTVNLAPTGMKPGWWTGQSLVLDSGGNQIPPTDPSTGG